MEEVNILEGQLERKRSEERPVIHQSQILPGTIKARHLGAKLHVVKFGDADDRPDEPGRIKAYFATDTNVLSFYNGTSWVSVTLS